MHNVSCRGDVLANVTAAYDSRLSLRFELNTAKRNLLVNMLRFYGERMACKVIKGV